MCASVDGWSEGCVLKGGNWWPNAVCAIFTRMYRVKYLGGVRSQDSGSCLPSTSPFLKSSLSTQGGSPSWSEEGSKQRQQPERREKKAFWKHVRVECCKSPVKTINMNKTIRTHLDYRISSSALILCDFWGWRAPLEAQLVKNPPAMRETWV